MPSDLVTEADAYVFDWSIDGTGTVRFVDDLVIEALYVRIRGDDVDRTVARFMAAFDTAAYTDFLATLAQPVISGSERERALELLGVTAPRSYDDAVFGAVVQGLDGDSVEVRCAATSAAGHLGWRQFRPGVQRIADCDPAPDNRAFATNVLYSLPQ
ncbi:hypothetical protein [Streptomyces sp. NPDC049881]|uniref:hypothetical protein n=1 Tax=Streptomyces sp. NPDC049881 TaxID=3155778 RepID=UPI003443CB2A